LERFAELGGGLSRFQINDEAQPDSRGTGKFILTQALSLADVPHNGTDFSRGEGSFLHGLSRAGIILDLPAVVDRNFPVRDISSTVGHEWL
jgi:hypothetical protein